MLARTIAALILLIFATAPSMACCEPVAVPQAVYATGGGHDHETHGQSEPAHDHAAAKPLCLAMCALAVAPASEAARLAETLVVADPGRFSAFTGQTPRPTSPPPRQA